MRKFLTTIGIFAFLATVITQSGCETESASDNSVRISPARVRVTNGQTVPFTASGGFDYSWALSDSTLGFISASTGPSTIYTANFQAPTNSITVQTLTVTSKIGSGGTNNTTTAAGFTKTAEAIIEHGPTTATAPVPGALVISPAGGATFTAIGSQLFTSSGEGPNYTWSMNDLSNGGLSSESGATTVYTYNTLTAVNKTILLTLTSNGRSVSVPIQLQVTPIGPLSISPASGATLSAVGNQLFTASGEGPNYTWSINDTSNGNISTTTGGSTVYSYQNLVAANKTITLILTSNGTSISVPILLVLPPSVP